MINKILHLADIHIRLYKREEEFRKVFSNLKRILEEQKPDRIVLAGDIVHSKNSLSPECIDQTYDFLKMLANFCDVDIILGNHDLILTNKKRLDAITPIVKSIDSPRIHLYTKSGLYNIDERLTYGVFSMVDEEYPVEFDREKNRIYAALFHGALSGAKLDNGYILKEAEADTGLFKNYDIGMLGDLHEFQEVSKNVVYSGSILQNKYSESKDKGIVLWDLNKKTFQFVKVENDWSYETIELDKQLNIPDLKVSKHPRIRLSIDRKLTITEKQTLQKECIDKFNAIEVQFKDTEENDKSVNKNDLFDLSNRSEIDKLLIDYFKDKDEEFKEKILKINKEVFEEIPEEYINKNIVWTLNSLKFSNIFSYGENNEINFSKLKGLVGIFAPNRSGKSSIISAILHTITGKNDKFKKAFDVVNNKSDNCIATATIIEDDNEYTIERSIKKGPNRSSSTKINFQTKNLKKSGDQNGITKTDTEKALRKLFGSYEDLTLTSFGTQGKITNFVENFGESYRIKIISKFLGLEIFEAMHNNIKKSVSNIELEFKSYKNLNYFNKLDENIIELNANREQKEKIQIELSKKENELDTLQETYREITKDFDEDKLRNLLADLKNNTAKLNSNIKILELKNQTLKDTKNFIEMASVSIKDIYETGLRFDIEELEKYVSEKNTLFSNIAVINSNLNKDQKQKNILDKQKWCHTNETCQTCNFFIDAKKITDLIDEQEQEKIVINNRLEQLKDIDANLNETKKKLDWFIKTSNNLSLANANLKTLEAERNTLHQSIDDLRLTIDQINNEKDRIVESFSRKDEFTALKQKLRTYQEDISSLKNILIEVSSKIMLNEQNITSIKEGIVIIKHLEQKYEIYKAYKDAVNKDGIPFIILSRTIETINSQINDILSDIVRFRVEIKTDEEEKDLSVDLIYEDQTRCPIEGASGMEKTTSAIAIRAALVKISNLPKCNIFVLDEFASTLDGKYISNIESLLNRLKMLFECVIIISHTQEIQDMVDMQISISKENGYSSVFV
jgi:DNA repair exonuclease SbcCD ATPase subunit/predicted phosphodiesterase